MALCYVGLGADKGRGSVVRRKYMTNPSEADRSGIHGWLRAVVRQYGETGMYQRLHLVMPNATWLEVKRLGIWARQAACQVAQERALEYQRKADYRINR